MPAQNQFHQAPPDYDQPDPGSEHGTAQEQSRMSRRGVLRGVVGVGAVGLAAAAGAGVAVVATQPSSQTNLPPTGKPVAMAPMAPNAVAGPLMVYLADTTTGEFDVYGGTGAVRIKNPALVSQLLKNVQLAW
jgi:hypothetical protein